MVFQGVVDYFEKLIDSGDIRSNQLPFVSDPTVVICTAVAYLAMVIAGPRFMKHRDAFQLKQVLIVYNFSLALFSMWMVREIFACSFLNPNFNLFCEDVDESDASPEAIRLVNALWCYYFSKFIELFDTAFYILRKKNNQISFLHVYHHVTILTTQWLLIKFIPGGALYFPPMVNCCVHAVMYTYYLLSAFGPHMQKYLWWKKYITSMQMIQFVVLIVYSTNTLRMGCRCWDTYTFFYLFFWTSLLYLFAKFYIRSYRQRKERKE